MNNQRLITLSLVTALLVAGVQGQDQPKKKKSGAKPSVQAITPAATQGSIVGSGTPGRVSKFAGVSGTNTYVIGDSVITEDKYGNVGVGTALPTSKLTVAGIIESLSGGIKFPDGTIQTTSASGALVSVFHDATLTGNGTTGSPLGVSIPLTLSGSVSGSTSQILKVTNNGGDGGAFKAIGGPANITQGGTGVLGIGGNATGHPSGIGVAGLGGDSSNGNGGAGVTGQGGFGRQGGVGIFATGGDGALLAGGDSLNARGGSGTQGGVGIVAAGGTSDLFAGGGGLRVQGGRSNTGSGGEGIRVFGGDSTSGAGGDGVVASGGIGPGGTGRAGLFLGDVQVNGNFDVVGGTKNFKMDHPLDPKNKYLYHAAIESSEVLNVYSGNVTTNEKGKAVVALPDWFEALDCDFRYQLTVVGTFAQAIVAEEVRGNRFMIRTSAPGVKVSWQVTGVRSDAAMRRRPFRVEEEKPETERGSYLVPEAFELPQAGSADSTRAPASTINAEAIRVRNKRK